MLGASLSWIDLIGHPDPKFTDGYVQGSSCQVSTSREPILLLSHPECLRLPPHFPYTHLQLLSGRSFLQILPCPAPLHWHLTETHGPSPSLGFPCFGVNSDFFLVALSAQ